VLAHRRDDTRASVEAREAGERVRHSLEGQSERDDAAAVCGGGDRLGIDLGGRGDFGKHRLLAGVLRQPVALARPAPRAAEREHRRVLPGAVVLEPRRASVQSDSAALELVLRGRCLGEKASDRVELLGPVEVRRARDRDLGLVEVGPRSDDGERLYRLGRAAEERDERGIAGARDDLALPHRDAVCAVSRLDDAAPRGLHDYGIHGG